MDNLNIHRRKSLTDLYGRRSVAKSGSGFTIHYTPTHGSWLNQAEIEIGLFSRNARYQKIPDFATLRGSPPLGIAGSITPAPKITWHLLRTRAGKFGTNRILLRGLRLAGKHGRNSAPAECPIAADGQDQVFPASGTGAHRRCSSRSDDQARNDISRALVDSCRNRCRHPLEALAGREAAA